MPVSDLKPVNKALQFFQTEDLKFECTRCGRCCTGKGSYVFITNKESDDIRQHLGLSKSWFKRKYLEYQHGGDLVLTQHDNGDCIFLDKENGCQIYQARPLQCHTYPFWPEIMASKKAWQSEKAGCEGINRGSIVSVHKILDSLALFADDE